MNKEIKIRKVQAGESVHIAAIFSRSVRSIPLGAYTAEQLEAWAPSAPDYELWEERCMRLHTFVAELEGRLAGFIMAEDGGHIDCLYVDEPFKQKGVGGTLVAYVEAEWKKKGCFRLFTEASLTARPFFEAMGFRTGEMEYVERKGLMLPRYRMEKIREFKMDIIKLRGTIVFVDMHGFHKLSRENEMEKVIHLLDDYYRTVGDTVKRMQGRLIKYMGDGILAVFTGKDHAQRAVEAFRSLHYPQGVSAAASLDTGDIYQTEIGHPDLLVEDIFGEPLNRASIQLQFKNKLSDRHEQVILTENTLAELEGKFQTAFIDEIKLSAGDKPLKSYQLLIPV